MGKEVQIRRMAPEDLERIAALETACFSKPWSVESLRTELMNPQAVFFSALTEGDLAGYAGMHNVLGEGYITNIAVSEDYRRHGIGRRLLQALDGFARENAMSFLTLEVRLSNAIAIELYKSMGFVEQGERRGFYESPKENALIMTKVY